MTQPLTITGSGQTIDDDSAARVFDVSGATFSASHLTLAKGNAQPDSGRGIYFSGSPGAQLDPCAISGGSAYNGGAVGTIGSAVTIRGSQIVSNSATNSGAGIDIRGASSLYVARSAISGDTADKNGTRTPRESEIGRLQAG